MRSKKLLFGLGLALIAIVTTASANIVRVEIGERHTYYRNGTEVGWAQRDCDGFFNSVGEFGDSVHVTYLNCP